MKRNIFIFISLLFAQTTVFSQGIGGLPAAMPSTTTPGFAGGFGTNSGNYGGFNYNFGAYQGWPTNAPPTTWNLAPATYNPEFLLNMLNRTTPAMLGFDISIDGQRSLWRAYSQQKELEELNKECTACLILTKSPEEIVLIKDKEKPRVCPYCMEIPSGPDTTSLPSPPPTIGATQGRKFFNADAFVQYYDKQKPNACELTTELSELGKRLFVDIALKISDDKTKLKTFLNDMPQNCPQKSLYYLINYNRASTKG